MEIPAAYRHIIDPLISHARGLLEKGETLASLAFVGSLKDGQVIPVVLDDESDDSKDSSARAISMTASALDADFVFMVREAWKLPQKYIDRYDEIMEEYGSVGASPYAQDVAAFSLETTHGTWVAMPFIKPKPPSKKRRTFGSVTFEHMPGLLGRFSNLLRDKQNDDGTLHWHDAKHNLLTSMMIWKVSKRGGAADDAVFILQVCNVQLIPDTGV